MLLAVIRCDGCGATAPEDELIDDVASADLFAVRGVLEDSLPRGWTINPRPGVRRHHCPECARILKTQHLGG